MLKVNKRVVYSRKRKEKVVLKVVKYAKTYLNRSKLLNIEG